MANRPLAYRLIERKATIGKMAGKYAHTIVPKQNFSRTVYLKNSKSN